MSFWWEAAKRPCVLFRLVPGSDWFQLGSRGDSSEPPSLQEGASNLDIFQTYFFRQNQFEANWGTKKRAVVRKHTAPEKLWKFANYSGYFDTF